MAVLASVVASRSSTRLHSTTQSLDSVSALLCCHPGRYCILKWYFCNLFAHLATCPTGFFILSNHYKAVWSVFMRNSRQYKYLWNCLMMASSSSLDFLKLSRPPPIFLLLLSSGLLWRGPKFFPSTEVSLMAASSVLISWLYNTYNNEVTVKMLPVTSSDTYIKGRNFEPRQNSPENKMSSFLVPSSGSRLWLRRPIT